MATEWYVVKVKRHQAALAESHLSLWGLVVYNPHILVLKSGVKMWEELFPGYLFCQVDASGDNPWPQAMWTPGVSYFLPPGDRPLPLNEQAMAEVQYRVETWNEGGYIWVFKKGDLIRVKSGPLKGLDAVFERYLPARQRCEVFLHWLGRRLRTVMDPTELDISTETGPQKAWVKGYRRITPDEPQISTGQDSDRPGVFVGGGSGR